MKYLVSCIILIFFLCFEGYSQEAVFPITNFTTKDYGRNFHPTNMAIAQDRRGIIYAANGFKLLEFDGSSWNSYPINKANGILSLAVDSSGIIYIGAQNEFGYFAPDSRGELNYFSLSDSLDILENDFTNIWKVHAFSDGVVFQAEEKIFLYRKGKLEIIKPLTSFHTSFIVNDKLYVRERGTGLMEWKDNNMVKIKGSEIFDTTGVFLMLPFGRNHKKILIGTQEKGFWIYEPENTSNRFFKFKNVDLPLFEKAIIGGGVLTGDGSFAISTRLNGLIIIDTAGITRAIINSKYGLSDNEVKQVILDKSKNLWLASAKGISSVEINSPLSVYDEKSGITGTINSIKRYKSLLYVGTSTGLFVQQPGKTLLPAFLQAFNIVVPVWSLAEVDERLVVGTDAGLFQISGDMIAEVGNEKSYTLFYSPQMKLLFSGGQEGLTVYQNAGSFKKLDWMNDIREDIIGITGESSLKGDTAEFWIGTRYNGIIRIKVYKNVILNVVRFNTADGLPGGPVTPYIFNSKTLFGTLTGLFEFINENIVKETLPDSLKNNKDFLKGYFSPVEVSTGNIGRSISSVVESNNKIWICSDNQVGYFDENNKMSYVDKPFSGIEMGKINVIYPERNGICWLGTTYGIIRYDENTGKNYNTDYYSLIRKVSLTDNDSLLFLGNNFGSGSEPEVSLKQPANLIPVIPFRNNSLRIDFSAPFYEYTNKIYYSYQLAGNNSKWSQWTLDHYQVYTNIREGNYTFRVKARNIYSKESSLAEYSFIISAPWYRTGIAYGFYVIVAIVLIWLIARIYSYRLMRENIRLEGIVTERTSEVVRQKDEIENKNTVLEYQKKEIEDSIRYARRIQSAVIPSEKDCLDLLPESFVFFKPLNIVSGDFYWISRVENRTIFTAADCTGHGVPGAIMSMLGIAFLNEIVNKDHITHPDIILNQLRNRVIQALQQQGISGEARDGMDIAMVCIDEKEKKLMYAGAYNPLIMIRNGEISEIVGDKMPIGIYEKMNPFTLHEILIEKEDVFYMASDGYEDQFGGPEGKKLKSKKFKQLLLEIHKNPMPLQKEIIEKKFEDWKGELTQVDDIVVIGITII
jgi:serine phosphatase RsbU (regulator of sigma subunit)/ligand-binding sensor domain-containing protein